MGDVLKDAFKQIQAEEALKNRTKQIIREKRKESFIKRRSFRALTAICLCFICILVVGNWVYFTPTSEINIDINPSLNLGVNRFDEVVTVDGLNEDGRDFSSQLNIKYKNYEDAIEQILANEEIETLLADDNVIVITVTGSDKAQSAQIYQGVETHSAHYENARCRQISSDDAKVAHDLGLSYGKYQAYLQLQELDASFTPEELQGMTMKEIQDLIDKLSNSTNPSTNETTPDSSVSSEETEDTTNYETVKSSEDSSSHHGEHHSHHE